MGNASADDGPAANGGGVARASGGAAADAPAALRDSLRCVDTSLGLKTRWGTGYQVRSGSFFFMPGR